MRKIEALDEINGIKYFIVPTQGMMPGFIEHGYANGYAIISKDHPYYNLPYYEIPINGIHGGLTFSGTLDTLDVEHENINPDSWVFGFDTFHYNDNNDNCNKEYCISQARKLAEQLSNVK